MPTDSPSESTPNRVHRFVSNDLTLRIAAVNATAVVQQMQNLQQSQALATMGVGRAMVGALLMASQLKEGQDVGLLFKGNGPLKSLYAEATFDGQVRGYCPTADYSAPKVDDLLNLGKALGQGTLSVARHQPFQRQPHHGTVKLVSGEIGDDLAHYLHQSHQIRSVVSLGVFLDTFGMPKAAGGVLIEVMPGVEEEVVDLLQANSAKVKIPVSKLLLDGAKAEDLLSVYLDGIEFTEIPHEHPVRYHCPCTVERVKRALTTLGDGGLKDMIEEDQQAQITCQVCGRQYQLELDDLVEIREELRRNSMH